MMHACDERSPSAGTSAQLGIIGVGAIAQAIVTGLCGGTHDPPSILLSPRGRARAGSLAARYPSVRVAQHNEAVVAHSETVLICLRPQGVRAVLRDLDFRPNQAVVSVMAGVSVVDLSSLVAPAKMQGRAVPLPAVARRRGLTAVYPLRSQAHEIFARLGDIVVAGDESALDALSATTATIAAHLAYVGEIGRWLAAHGVAEADATRYVAALFAAVASTLDRAPVDFRALTEDHATPGGINEQFLTSFRDARFFELVDHSLDEVLRRLQGGASEEAATGRTQRVRAGGMGHAASIELPAAQHRPTDP